jgi:hypothetical protein
VNPAVSQQYFIVQLRPPVCISVARHQKHKQKIEAVVSQAVSAVNCELKLKHIRQSLRHGTKILIRIYMHNMYKPELGPLRVLL